MAQTIKSFISDAIAPKKVDEQIQEWLAAHPHFRVSELSYVATGISREALVVFESSGQVTKPGNNANTQRPQAKAGA